jgi:hypothetical protein
MIDIGNKEPKIVTEINIGFANILKKNYKINL